MPGYDRNCCPSNSQYLKISPTSRPGQMLHLCTACRDVGANRSSCWVTVLGPDKKGEAPIGLDVTIMVLEDVIFNRAECATWYEQKTPPSARDENFEKTYTGLQHYFLVLR